MFRFGRNKGRTKGQEDQDSLQNTASKKGRTRAQERLAKKILGKDTGRRVFGFACYPDIQAEMKMLAGELQIPIFALAEHALELSARVIAKAIEDPEERELLRKHLVEIHVDRRTIEKFSWYDEELAKDMNEDRLRRFEIDRAVRQIVVYFARKGMKPSSMAWYIDYGYRCLVAVVNGRPVPKPEEGPFHRKSQSSANQAAEEKKDKMNDEFPK